MIKVKPPLSNSLQLSRFPCSCLSCFDVTIDGQIGYNTRLHPAQRTHPDLHEACELIRTKPRAILPKAFICVCQHGGIPYSKITFKPHTLFVTQNKPT